MTAKHPDSEYNLHDHLASLTGDVYRKPAVGGGHPRGVVLVAAFAALAVISLLGAALLLNTRVEIQIAGNTSQGRDAFTRADAGAIISAQLLDTLMRYGADELDMDSYLTDTATIGPSGNTGSAYQIDFPEGDNGRRFDRTDLLTSTDPDRLSVLQRYSLAGMGEGDKALKVPDIVIRDRGTGQVVSTAAISRDFESDVTGNSGHMVGASIGTAISGSSGDAQPVSESFSVSIFGRQPSDKSPDSFYGVYDYDLLVGPQSVISMLYRAVFYY